MFKNNFVDDKNIHSQPGPPGPQGPPGPGFKKTSDGNYDAEDKKLANLQKCVDEKDAENRKYVDDQFTPVMMTRNVFSKGISMQDGRIEGLPDPVSEADAARKKYVDDRDEVKTAEMRAFALTEDQKLTQKIADGDKFKSIQTKNMLNLKSGDFNSSDFNVFILGEYRDFTQKYHNSKTHVVCSLLRNSGPLLINIAPLKRGKYGVRIEGIIDPKDDESSFDLDVSEVNTGLIITRTKYKEKIDPHAVAIGLEIELRADTENLNIALNITHVPGKEIALFIFGRRGEGHVDPQIIDNINYYEKIKIPRYRSFEINSDRRSEIGFDTTFIGHIVDLNKILGKIQKDYYFHFFRFNERKSPIGKYFEFRFPCIISLDKLKLRQEKDVSQGNWQVKYLDEKDGVFKDAHNSFTWNGKEFEVEMDKNVGRVFRLQFASERLYANQSSNKIHPIFFTLKESYF